MIFDRPIVLKFIYLYQDTSRIFKQISNLVQNKYKIFEFLTIIQLICLTKKYDTKKK
jgi:hypothetical protein